MKSLMLAIAVSSLAGLATVSAPSQAHAQVGISVNLGDVSVGYRDGYYDSRRRWHRWHRDNDWNTWRQAHPERARDFDHDRYGNRDDRDYNRDNDRDRDNYGH